MTSQHLISIALYEKLHHVDIRCDENLGMEILRKLRGASPGVGGGLLFSAIIDRENVVIKVFPSDCPFKYIKNTRKNNTNLRDYGNYEPGTGLLFTNIFIITSITQNITTCYNLSTCEYAYSTEISKCTRNPIPPQESFVVTDDQSAPLHSMMTVYNSTIQQGPYEIPSRSDIIRSMMVEQCQGDIQDLLESGNYTFELLEKIILMVFHTLLIFDCILEGYSHNDLGTRNVLYTNDTTAEKDTYWRYYFPSGPSIVSIDIPTTTLIPKIWDFAFVRFGTAAEYRDYYSYFDGTVPDLSRISEERENDVFIFLSDIIKISGGKIFNIDLENIRKARNNTEAVYIYLTQNPWSSELNSDKSHRIIHSFPPDINIFSGLDMNRQVLPN